MNACGQLTAAAVPTGRPVHTAAVPRRPAAGGLSAAGIDALLASARREVLVMSRLAVARPDPIGGVRRVDHDNVRRGVRYRVLVPDPARTEPVLATRLGMLSVAGADTRTVAEVPADALVIDGTAVVLPADWTASGRIVSTAMFQLPSVVTTAIELFERVWPTAVPLLPCERPEYADQRARERALIELLSTGCTDELAAAQLELSVRTVRRTVSNLMDRLGARSRFQLGVKAASCGLTHLGP